MRITAVYKGNQCRVRPDSRWVQARYRWLSRHRAGVRDRGDAIGLGVQSRGAGASRIAVDVIDSTIAYRGYRHGLGLFILRGLPQPIIIEEKEDLVFLDRAAKIASELIADQWRTRYPRRIVFVSLAGSFIELTAGQSHPCNCLRHAAVPGG